MVVRQVVEEGGVAAGARDGVAARRPAIGAQHIAAVGRAQQQHLRAIAVARRLRLAARLELLDRDLG